MELYTAAIEAYGAPDSNVAIFYCNRAAAHLVLDSPDLAVDDCTRALELMPKYARGRGWGGAPPAAVLMYLCRCAPPRAATPRH